MENFDVCVRGAGIVGKSLALALARQGLRVALLPEGAAAAQRAGEDIRAYALNAVSIGLLERLKVWDSLPAQAKTAVHDMRVHGDAAGGEIDFSAWQQRVGELAWIVDAGVLERQLEDALRYAPHVTLIDPARGAPPSMLLALCEGKASATRDALGVTMARNAYGHTAIATRLVAAEAHRNTAWQWFRAPDVLALLPLDTPQGGHSFALVWSLPDDRAQQLLALADAGFEQALFDATGGACGALRLAAPRAAWPLMLATADRWCGEGWVLLGDAAHVVHPLSGQGLNLGLADVVALAQAIEEREPWRALGDEKLLRRYARERAAPTWAMGRVTDGLLQLFSRPEPAVQELRNRGMSLVNRLPPIKRWLASRAVGS
ncbi:MAG TPA: FAD-dependent monooxygenase [Burkholderiaceae bacterium]|nr:FAD-dependent monooxygenase [Burkholderiaceae bacterium]